MDSARPMKSGPILAPGVPVIQKSPDLRFAPEPHVTKRTKTEISLEIQEEIAIRTHRISKADCPVCRSEVRMIPANEAAMMARVTARAIYQRVSSGELHFMEDRFGLLYVCSESLRNLPGVEPDEIAKAADNID